MSLDILTQALEGRFSRRTFLKGSGALIVSFSLFPTASGTARAQQSDNEQPSLDAFLAIAEDGSVTARSGRVELGHGVATALRQIVAEELGVPFAAITWLQGETDVVPDQGPTVGSSTIRSGGAQLRLASATARNALLALAAERLETPLENLSVTDGVVSAGEGDANSVSYGELIGGARFEITLDESAALKDVESYSVVGQSVPRTDIPDKIAGTFQYVQNVRIPGMLHGRVVRPGVANARLVSVDESSVEALPGLVQVVTRENFVGVVANREEEAVAAARALSVTWEAAGERFPANRDALFQYLNEAEPASERAVVERGDAASALESAPQVLEAAYEWPFQMHGMIGPSCGVADVSAEGATIYSGSQWTFALRRQAAALLGLEPESINVVYDEASGCYGRLFGDDAALEAAVLSQAVGSPVRVQWMRQEEHVWEPKGPPHVIRVRAGLDGDGRVTGWSFTDRGMPWITKLPGLEVPPDIGGFPDGSEGGGEVYAFENLLFQQQNLPWDAYVGTPLRTTSLRAPGDYARAFASETFIDELAEAAGIDPVEFRYQNLENPRLIEALRRVAEAAGWQARVGRAGSQDANGVATGQGVAVGDRGGSLVAMIAEVRVNTGGGQVAVTRITCAHDCGLIVNPDGVRAQVEGNLVQMTGRALKEEVAFSADTVTSVDWASYPILTFAEVPELEVILIDRPEEASTGAGEPASVPVAAAIANAIYDATGARLRTAPFTANRMLAALNG